MAEISLVKTLVLSYMELQRQIDAHHQDAPSYILKDLREQQDAILNHLEAKEPVELGQRQDKGTILTYGPNYIHKTEAEARQAFEQLLDSQKEEVE